MTSYRAIIKPIEEMNLPLLEEWFPEGGPIKHAERLGRQAKGDVHYLFAWVDEQPVGHLLLKWHGIEDEQVSSLLRKSGHVKPIPDIEDFFVFRSLRSQGIGRQILQFSERLALKHGHHQIGLSVGVENEKARKLYERFGFQDAGLGEFVEQGRYIDRLGQEQSWSERCLYLIKPIHESTEGREQALSAS